MTGKKDRPNFLLCAFIGASLVIHALLMFNWAGVESPEPAKRIEVAIGEPSAPPSRTLPQPPSALREPAPERAFLDPDIRADAPDLADAKIPDLSALSADDLNVPDIGADLRLPIAVWEEAKSGSTGSPPGDDIKKIFFDRVRMSIEKRKEYPASARRRRLEGEVVLKFTIGRDGRLSQLSVVKGSRFSSLDNAALAAVRAAAPFPPLPADIFDGPLELTVPIRFELMN